MVYLAKPSPFSSNLTELLAMSEKSKSMKEKWNQTLTYGHPLIEFAMSWRTLIPARERERDKMKGGAMILPLVNISTRQLSGSKLCTESFTKKLREKKGMIRPIFVVA